MGGTLDGILVVALEQAVAAPLASCRLADAGARVIKIERSEGDFARYYIAAGGQSTYFVWLNRGKESLVLDIKDEDDRALLHRLIAQADVFIQNLAPGAASRAGFDPADLCRRFSRPSSPVRSPPWRGRSVSRHESLRPVDPGRPVLADITGSPEAPGRVGVSVSDIAAGMNAYAGDPRGAFRA